MSTQKALELLGLPEELAPFEGQVQTRTTRQLRVYEITDFTGVKASTYYTCEITPDVTQDFGMYPFNYAAGLMYHGGFSAPQEDEGDLFMIKPSAFVTHAAPSSLAGQKVYYVETKVRFKHTTSGAVIDYMYEPFETVVNGKAEDMKDPLITCGYYARTIRKGSDGKPRISWTSRYPINPKRRLRKTELLKIMNISLNELMHRMRTSWNIVKVSPSTHITSIAMDIEPLPNSQFKSVVYINGQDAQTFDFELLTNSFGKKYTGYLWQWRLYNGQPSTPNAYGSTINIGINSTADSTITLELGSENKWDAEQEVLTYNADQTEVARLLAYMEFLPAQGKNENVGKDLNLETGVERLF